MENTHTLVLSIPSWSWSNTVCVGKFTNKDHHNDIHIPSCRFCLPISTGFTSTTKTNSPLFIREKRIDKSSIGVRLTAKMAENEGKAVTTADVLSGDMIFEPILEDGVFRFDCYGDDRNAAYPSLSFVNTKDRDTPIMSHKVPLYTPTFECLLGQQIVELELPAGTSLYGTGEVSGQLERTGKRVFTWNTDAWGYGPGTTSLYQSHPWVLAVLPNGEALGFLADTTRRCEIDLRKESSIRVSAPSSYPVITFGPFSSPTAVLISLSHAIGTVFMPPKWSLGYHQCRWSYDSAKRVLEIARTFREKDIPCDVIWMDIDYMDRFRCFTFDQERFPEPKSLVKDLHHIGFKAIWMLDPGIKREEGYFVYDSGATIDVWIQKEDGKTFVGEVWPGPCVFPDFTQSKVRSWWANLVKDFTSNGVDGIWNDMNEPSIFKDVTKTMPESNIHRGDDELGGCQNHSHYHNVYGMLMARSTYEGMKLADEKKRPFVLTRAGFIGSQRYAATWTGDNLSNWEHLHMCIPMVLQLGLSGQPLSGPDIGGFAGNASPRLFGRWMGIGAMFPFCRGHSETDTIDHEPWSFGEECEEVCRLALKRRYRLIPHIYTLFYLAHQTGTPVATPTFFADTQDPSLRTIENAFLLGPLLVYASTIPDQGSDILQHALPKGIWMRFDFDDSHPDLPALYLQGGSIIPLGPPHQHVGESKPSDDLILLVALDEHGIAKGILFEDDGDGYGFTEGGYLLTHYVAELQSSVLAVRVNKVEGSWKRPERRLHVQLLLGGGAMLSTWGKDGEVIEIIVPSEDEVSRLVSMSEKQYRKHLENAKLIPAVEEVSGHKGAELSRTPIELKSGDWLLKVVPWIGGRIISMLHLPSGTQWLHSRVEIDGYEEYTGTEYRSAGCTEEYNVIERNLGHAGEEESLMVEGDIGGGLVLQRLITIPKDMPEVFRIDSSIIAHKVGAGSGGFSRLVCLRVHPTFTLLHPTESFVSFTSINGSKHEIWPESGEQHYEGDLMPNGEWVLVDKCLGLGLINRFNPSAVNKCLIHWGTGTVNLELWSEDRPVSLQSPLKICHTYEVKKIL
ncbi:Glyco_hydro_31 domain-containing protein/Gal_mutarotas_2 domain-containing protein [Cephalotus follicularis]|uniref:Glyco_hydro_31 domain-containing protein/Gal_mutarotas_2 domain-containing protein n=1 Tax=Cephalotus follicularis TaxID=3775 RepID=A0A1Q3DDJ8_CEPFO|nr:Glyco_hydro_31 domain-containing protein/Gal_mutarotas_2 domain-containing protein [Cephalotus follicularis]